MQLDQEENGFLRASEPGKIGSMPRAFTSRYNATSSFDPVPRYNTVLITESGVPGKLQPRPCQGLHEWKFQESGLPNVNRTT